MTATRHVGVHCQGDLRQEMIDAAAAALAEIGTEHLSLRDMARGAGVSHAAPARHLGDKAGVLTAVAVQGSELFAGYLSTTADRVDSPLEALHANGRAYLEFSDLYPGHFEIMFRPALISTGVLVSGIAGDKAWPAIPPHDIARPTGPSASPSRPSAATTPSRSGPVRIITVTGQLRTKCSCQVNAVTRASSSRCCDVA